MKLLKQNCNVIWVQWRPYLCKYVVFMWSLNGVFCIIKLCFNGLFKHFCIKNSHLINELILLEWNYVECWYLGTIFDDVTSFFIKRGICWCLQGVLEKFIHRFCAYETLSKFFLVYWLSIIEYLWSQNPLKSARKTPRDLSHSFIRLIDSDEWQRAAT